MTQKMDVIPPETAKTLDGMFQERVRRSPKALAYKNFDEPSGTEGYTWTTSKSGSTWQGGLRRTVSTRRRWRFVLRNSARGGLRSGCDGVDWSRTLYTSDRPENIATSCRTRSEVPALENRNSGGNSRSTGPAAGSRRCLLNPLSGHRRTE